MHMYDYYYNTYHENPSSSHSKDRTKKNKTHPRIKNRGLPGKENNDNCNNQSSEQN